MADIDKVIAENMGLVYKQLHRFKLQNDEDAYSWALEALWKAIKTYNSTKGYAFSTYAMTCIYNALGCYLRSLRKLDKLEVVSYDCLVDEEQDTSFVYFLASNDTPDEALIAKETRRNTWRIFHEVLCSFDGANAAILRYWKESDFSATQMEIARHFDVSQAHVSRTLSAFKHKLKKRLEEYQCEK